MIRIPVHTNKFSNVAVIISIGAALQVQKGWWNFQRHFLTNEQFFKINLLCFFFARLGCFLNKVSGKQKRRIISVGTYAELKTLQMTVNMVNIIKKRKIMLTKPASKQTVLNLDCVTHWEMWHSFCLFGIFVTGSRHINSFLSVAFCFQPNDSICQQDLLLSLFSDSGTHRLESDYKIIPICPLSCSLLKVHWRGVLCQINWQARVHCQIRLA